MIIETYGVGERLREAARLCQSLRVRHLILLPIPTSKDGKYITGTDILLEDTLQNAGKDTQIVGYALPEEYKERCNGLGARVLDLLHDVPFVEENARLSALGVIGYLLTNTDRAPRDMKIGVAGYGRIGKDIVRTLLFLGASPTVYTSHIEVAQALAECGISAVCGYPCSFSGLDVLINTAPRDMRDCFENTENMPRSIIEVASGKNFEGIDCVSTLSAIPEKSYPKSAAKAYFEAVKRWAI